MAWFLAFLAKPAIVGLVKFVIGSAVAYFAAKPIIERWGSTPANRLQDLGVPKSQQYEDAQRHKEDKKKFFDEKNEKTLEELDDLKKKLDKLEKQKTQQTQEVANEDDPVEKAKKAAALQETEKELTNLRQEIKSKEKQIEQNNKEITKIFDELGKTPDLTQEQLVAKSNSPDLGAWKNWGIIAVCVIIAILIVKFIFGLFQKLSKGIE